MNDQPPDFSLSADLEHHRLNLIGQRFGPAAQYCVAGSDRVNVRRKREGIELLFEPGLAEEVTQRRAQVLKVFCRRISCLTITGHIEPGRLAVAQEELGTRLLIIPPHASRFLQQQDAILATLDSISCVALGG